MAFEQKDFISIYAAVISTIVAGWNIFKEYKKRQSKIVFFYDKKSIEEDEKFKKYHHISIVNRSETTIFINKLFVENRFSNDTNSDYEDTETTYPIRLIQNEPYYYKIRAEATENSVLVFDIKAMKKNDPVSYNKAITHLTVFSSRLTVLDTTGKKFQSDWLDLKIIPLKDY